MNSILATYDISSIQDYIFSSGRLSQNSGLSRLIGSLLENAIRTVIPDAYGRYSNNDIVDKAHTQVLYIGGGNAQMIFGSQEEYSDFNRKLYMYVEENSGGLRIVTAKTDCTDDFQKDWASLQKQLEQKKNIYAGIRTCSGFSLDRTDEDGKPAVLNFMDNGVVISSRKTFLARKEITSPNSERGQLCPAGYYFTKDLEDLAGDESASFIAIIHIDGNSMGETVTNLMKNFRDYDEAIENIKDISKCIDYNYREAFKSAILSTINKMGINNNTLRIKPLIFDGDDITVACDAKLAFELAVSTLNEISNKEIRGNRMSACAGICIAKAHFPFSKAYKIAEEATTEAKKRSREYPGTSWLDYHINFSGLTGSLRDIREKWYQLNLGDESKSLIQRPYLVCGQVLAKVAEWDDLIKRVKEVTYNGKAKLPASKIKTLRNAYIKSIDDVEAQLEILKYKNQKVINESLHHDELSYYDALEIMDFIFMDKGGLKNEG